MLYYVITYTQPTDTNQYKNYKATRADHLSRLQELTNTGSLLTSGYFPAIDTENPGIAGFNGCLIIARFDSLEAAKQWAQADPFIVSKVYNHLMVEPFKPWLP